MSPTVQQAIDEERALTEAEAESFVAERVQQIFGLTVEKFIELAEAGELDDHPATAQMAALTGAQLPTC